MAPRAARAALLAGIGAVLALLAAPAAAGAAQAAEGSVPPVVASYVDDDLIDRLDSVFGPSDEQPGTDFSAATAGPVVQVFFLTEDSRAGRGLDAPVVPRTEWMVSILVAGQPIGAAVVAADADLGDVHLDAFYADPGLGSRISTLGPTAALVHDPPTSSWFALDESTVFPLASGTSGVVSARPLDRMDLDRAPPRVDPINPGTVGALAAFAGLVLVGLLALAVPRLLQRRLDPRDSDPRLARGRSVG